MFYKKVIVKKSTFLFLFIWLKRSAIISECDIRYLYADPVSQSDYMHNMHNLKLTSHVYQNVQNQ